MLCAAAAAETVNHRTEVDPSQQPSTGSPAAFDTQPHYVNANDGSLQLPKRISMIEWLMSSYRSREPRSRAASAAAGEVAGKAAAVTDNEKRWLRLKSLQAASDVVSAPGHRSACVGLSSLPAQRGEVARWESTSATHSAALVEQEGKASHWEEEVALQADDLTRDRDNPRVWNIDFTHIDLPPTQSSLLHSSSSVRFSQTDAAKACDKTLDNERERSSRKNSGGGGGGSADADANTSDEQNDRERELERQREHGFPVWLCGKRIGESTWRQLGPPVYLRLIDSRRPDAGANASGHGDANGADLPPHTTFFYATDRRTLCGYYVHALSRRLNYMNQLAPLTSASLSGKWIQWAHPAEGVERALCFEHTSHCEKVYSRILSFKYDHPWTNNKSRAWLFLSKPNSTQKLVRTPYYVSTLVRDKRRFIKLIDHDKSETRTLPILENAHYHYVDELRQIRWWDPDQSVWSYLCFESELACETTFAFIRATARSPAVPHKALRAWWCVLEASRVRSVDSVYVQVSASGVNGMWLRIVYASNDREPVVFKMSQTAFVRHGAGLKIQPPVQYNKRQTYLLKFDTLDDCETTLKTLGSSPPVHTCARGLSAVYIKSEAIQPGTYTVWWEPNDPRQADFDPSKPTGTLLHWESDSIRPETRSLFVDEDIVCQHFPFWKSVQLWDRDRGLWHRFVFAKHDESERVCADLLEFMTRSINIRGCPSAALAWMTSALPGVTHGLCVVVWDRNVPESASFDAERPAGTWMRWYNKTTGELLGEERVSSRTRFESITVYRTIRWLTVIGGEVCDLTVTFEEDEGYEMSRGVLRGVAKRVTIGTLQIPGHKELLLHGKSYELLQTFADAETDATTGSTKPPETVVPGTTQVDLPMTSDVIHLSVPWCAAKKKVTLVHEELSDSAGGWDMDHTLGGLPVDRWVADFSTEDESLSFAVTRYVPNDVSYMSSDTSCSAYVDTMMNADGHFENARESKRKFSWCALSWRYRIRRRELSSLNNMSVFGTIVFPRGKLLEPVPTGLSWDECTVMDQTTLRSKPLRSLDSVLSKCSHLPPPFQMEQVEQPPGEIVVPPDSPGVVKVSASEAAIDHTLGYRAGADLRLSLAEAMMGPTVANEASSAETGSERQKEAKTGDSRRNSNSQAKVAQSPSLPRIDLDATIRLQNGVMPLPVVSNRMKTSNFGDGSGVGCGDSPSAAAASPSLSSFRSTKLEVLVECDLREEEADFLRAAPHVVQHRSAHATPKLSPLSVASSACVSASPSPMCLTPLNQRTAKSASHMSVSSMPTPTAAHMSVSSSPTPTAAHYDSNSGGVFESGSQRRSHLSSAASSASPTLRRDRHPPPSPRHSPSPSLPRERRKRSHLERLQSGLAPNSGPRHIRSVSSMSMYREREDGRSNRLPSSTSPTNKERSHYKTAVATGTSSRHTRSVSMYRERDGERSNRVPSSRSPTNKEERRHKGSSERGSSSRHVRSVSMHRERDSDRRRRLVPSTSPTNKDRRRYMTAVPAGSSSRHARSVSMYRECDDERSQGLASAASPSGGEGRRHMTSSERGSSSRHVRSVSMHRERDSERRQRLAPGTPPPNRERRRHLTLKESSSRVPPPQSRSPSLPQAREQRQRHRPRPRVFSF